MSEAIIPEKVTIAAITYPIETIAEPLVRNDRVCYGAIDFEIPGIFLSGGKLSGERKEMTLVHEIVHGINHDRGLSEMLGDREEEFTLQFARGLYAFMKDNGLWFKPEEDMPIPYKVIEQSEPFKLNPDPHRPPDGFTVTSFEMEIAHDAGLSAGFAVTQALRKVANDMEASPFEYGAYRAFTGTGEIGIRYKFGEIKPQLGATE